MPLLSRVAINFIYKLILFPSILFGFSDTFPDLVYFSGWLPILLLVGLFIFIGLVADETLLPKLGNLKATTQGFIFMTVVIWLSQFLFLGSSIHIIGALSIGLMLGIAEYLMHGWILVQRGSISRS